MKYTAEYKDILNPDHVFQWLPLFGVVELEAWMGTEMHRIAGITVAATEEGSGLFCLHGTVPTSRRHVAFVWEVATTKAD